MFKLGAALVFAAIAGLTAMVAGLLSDARLQIVLGRAFCSFIVAGVVVYLGIVLFDRLGYASIIHEMEENMEKAAEEEEDLNGDEEPEEGSEADSEGIAEDENEGFVPLQADELRHVAEEPVE
ncbi:hypothetical protein [uncultured Anaerovibrio sp.]|uniref:hypothetical protein n=1 Tax=uncultured Anaerovibrio sp. TaxID=361586 RepID=UPI0025FAF5C8|nr:hypothetical protein [uncultured Anaerovibrio sp.]